MFNINDILRLAGVQAVKESEICDDKDCTDAECPVHGKDKVEETASAGASSAGGIASVAKPFTEDDDDNYDWLAAQQRRSRQYRPGEFEFDEVSKLDEEKDEDGNRIFHTFKSWVRACKALKPGVRFEGDEDICQAFGCGEWDGETGYISKDAPYPTKWDNSVNEDSAFDELAGTADDYSDDISFDIDDDDDVTHYRNNFEVTDVDDMIQDILAYSDIYKDQAKLETLPYAVIKRIHDKVMGETFESTLDEISKLAGISNVEESVHDMDIPKTGYAFNDPKKDPTLDDDYKAVSLEELENAYRILKNAGLNVSAEEIKTVIDRRKNVSEASPNLDKAASDYTLKNFGDFDNDDEDDEDDEDLNDLENSEDFEDIPVDFDIDLGPGTVGSEVANSVDDIAEIIADILMTSNKYNSEQELVNMPVQRLRAIHKSLMDEGAVTSINTNTVDANDYFPNGYDGNVVGAAGPSSAKSGDNALQKAFASESIDDIRASLHEALNKFKG